MYGFQAFGSAACGSRSCQSYSLLRHMLELCWQRVQCVSNSHREWRTHRERERLSSMAASEGTRRLNIAAVATAAAAVI